MDLVFLRDAPGKRPTRNLLCMRESAYISVTGLASDNFPTTFEEPVRVVTYELKPGDELDAGQDFDSLQEFLEKHMRFSRRS